MGSNSTATVFIEAYAWTNELGEICDPWRRPYVFSFASNSVTVTSSGPNKVFGDDDDVARSRMRRLPSARPW